MAILVRKISSSKWPEAECDLENLPADVFWDLRTTQNELSLWRVESKDYLQDAMLALAASTNATGIEKIELAWISEDAIGSAIQMKESDGDTAVKDLVGLHRDACNLTYSSLGQLAQIFLTGLLQGQKKVFLRKEVKTALVEAHQQKRLCFPETKNQKKSKLEEAIEKEASKAKDLRKNK